MQRALGEVDLAIASGSLRRCFQSGSAKLFLPKTYSDNIEAVLVNTAGGIAEGDGFKYRVQASDKTNITITTQAAERVYGAIASRVANLNIDLTITCGTSLHWLPQETIHRHHLLLGDKGATLTPGIFQCEQILRILTDGIFKDMHGMLVSSHTNPPKTLPS